MGHPKRKLVFQPSIFGCYVSFREGTYILILIHHSGFMKAQFCRIESTLESQNSFRISPNHGWILEFFGKFHIPGRWRPELPIFKTFLWKKKTSKTSKPGWLSECATGLQQDDSQLFTENCILKGGANFYFPWRGNCRIFLLLEGCGKTVPGNGIDERGSSWETSVEIHKLP